MPPRRKEGDMAKKLVLLVAGVVLGAAVAGTVMSASAAPPNQPTTLTFTDKTVKDTSVDNGAKGFSAGDQDISHDVLLQNGKVVGKFDVMSAISSVNKKPQSASVVFTGTFKISGGEIAVA